MSAAAMPFPRPGARLAVMLVESAPCGDLTTQERGIDNVPGGATLRARAAITVACVEEAERLMLVASCARVDRFAASGAQVEAGADLLVTSAPYAAPPLEVAVAPGGT